jgi:predicted heme/steroid binding protein
MTGRAVRLFFGYLHIVTAFMWFGTILYVHLVLKPAYASQGLPRGEVRVGLASMAIMAVSGAVLTWFKIDSWGQLVSSRFGILLLAKIGIFSVMVVSALYVVLLIGPKLKRKTTTAVPESGDFSPAELAGFDGGDGRPAYIAYQGKVYDAGASKLWKNGSHMKRHQAGIDLTAMLSQAPHGEDKVLALPEVGRLVGRKTPDRDQSRRRVFYFMAYMNLGLVFLITLILALWRWF